VAIDGFCGLAMLPMWLVLGAVTSNLFATASTSGERIFCSMKFIELSKGYKTKVDDEDYEWLSKWSWHFHPGGYAIAWVDTRKVLMHRLIMKTRKGKDTDHINGDKLDNQRSNLRICTRSENLRNKHKILAASGFKGVFKGNPGYWQTMITFNGKAHSLGHFREKRHAALAYDIWAKDIFGAYAHTNFKSLN
jgi:hypothetical protein